MLKRKIDQFFMDWKVRKHKPLLLEGARQTGKTTSVREFGKTYTHFLEINFIENPEMAEIFNHGLDFRTLKTNILLALHQKDISSDCLLFFDEIQRCENALTSLKFFAEQGEWDVIASGSEQGVLYGIRNASWPVGYLEYQVMNGLDFEEFLWSFGTPESVLQILKDHLGEFKPIPPYIHDQMMSLLRQYMVIGGMPEAVNEYCLTHNYQNVHVKQMEIFRGYIDNIAIYAPPEIKQKAQLCYQSVSKQLDKSNHKFKYSVVEHKGSARKFGTSIHWLEAARMITTVYNISDVQYPVSAYEDSSDFRIYPSEIGLLMGMYSIEMKNALLNEKSVEAASTIPALKTAKGGLYEALAADMLYKAGFENLHFYSVSRNTMEIEFILDGAMGPIPIEIKAGRGKSRSLDHLLEMRPEITGYKFGSFNIGKSANKFTLPLYCLPFLKEHFAPTQEDWMQDEEVSSFDWDQAIKRYREEKEETVSVG